MGKHFFILSLISLTFLGCSEMKPSSALSEDSLTHEDSNFLSDLFQFVADEVDSHFTKKELTQERIKRMNHSIDSCIQNAGDLRSFAEIQNYFILKHFEDRQAELTYVSNEYVLPTTKAKFYPTSLISHEFCPITETSLKTSLKEWQMPDPATIEKLNQFSNIHNKLRGEYLAHRSYNSKLQIGQHWSKLTSCLAYVESLSTADSSASKAIAKRYSPSGYDKPPGVGFYEDPNQPPESKLNMGVYQFTPDIEGNIKSCVRQWNGMYPNCAFPSNSSFSDIFKVLGSEYQTFNIFCGINKIHQMFSVQVNTTNKTFTHIKNIVGSKIKKSGERCVSLNFYSGYSYNHFGPFQNSTGNNLKELMSCYFR